jgi:hypothetical protein
MSFKSIATFNAFIVVMQFCPCFLKKHNTQQILRVRNLFTVPTAVGIFDRNIVINIYSSWSSTNEKSKSKDSLLKVLRNKHVLNGLLAFECQS